MYQNQNSRAPADASTFRKRPRQTLIANPQTRQPGPAPGPSGAATYPDLMPVGGFNRTVNRQGTIPNSGRGAANFNRTTSFNGKTHTGYSNQPRGQCYQTEFNPGNHSQCSSGQYQLNVGGNSSQTGMGGSYNQYNVDGYNAPNGLNQTVQYPYGNTTIGCGYDQGNWNSGNQSYCANTTTVNTRNIGNNRHVPNGQPSGNYQQPPNTRDYHPQQQQQQRQQHQQWGQPKNQCQEVGNGGAGQGRRSNYGTSTFTNNSANYANDIPKEMNISFPESTAALPGTSSSSAPKDMTKVSGTGKTAVSEVKKSLHFLTVDIAGVKRWSKFKDSIQIMFEVFGQLDSAIARDKADCKQFLVRDDKKNPITCVFYEIDRQLPKLTRGQWYRIVGTYDESKELFKCFSIRTLQPAEGSLAPLLSQKSAEIMGKLKRGLRES